VTSRSLAAERGAVAHQLRRDPSGETFLVEQVADEVALPPSRPAHRVERLGELAELVGAIQRHARRIVAVGDALRVLRQRQYGLG